MKGGLGVDGIKRTILLSKSKLKKTSGIKFLKKSLLVTFHPVTLENQTSERQFKVLLDCLSGLCDTNIIFTKSQGFHVAL